MTSKEAADKIREIIFDITGCQGMDAQEPLFFCEGGITAIQMTYIFLKLEAFSSVPPGSLLTEDCRCLTIQNLAEHLATEVRIS